MKINNLRGQKKELSLLHDTFKTSVDTLCYHLYNFIKCNFLLIKRSGSITKDVHKWNPRNYATPLKKSVNTLCLVSPCTDEEE